MPTLGGAEDAEILLPLPLGPKAPQTRNREDYNILARLKPGVTVAQAQAEMDALTARLRQEHPDFYPPNGGLTFSVVPLQEQVVGDVRAPLILLIGAVGVRAADRLRQRREPAAVARARPAEGDRGPRGARREPRPHRPAAADRERAARARRAARSGWCWRSGASTAIHALGTEQRAAPARHRIDGGRAALHAAVSLAAGVIFGLCSGAAARDRSICTRR